MIPGFLSMIAFLPNDGLGVAVTLNTYVPDSVVKSIGLRTIDKALNLYRSNSSEKSVNHPPLPRSTLMQH